MATENLRIVETAQGADEESKPAAALHLRLVKPLAVFVSEQHGAEALARFAAAAELEPSQLLAANEWVSSDAFERLLLSLDDLVQSDTDAFRAACAYKMAEGYGPLRFLVWATSPDALYQQAARNFTTISRVSRLEATCESRTRIRLRYETSVAESRLMCLSRQAQMAAGPTLWGLPKAELEEHGCVARGDDACVYVLRIYEVRRWLPILVGLLLGLLGGWVLSTAHLAYAWITMPVLGALLGYLAESRRAYAANLALATENNEALGALAREEADVRTELIELHRRQAEWAKLMEEQVAARTGGLEKVIERLTTVGEARAATLRGYSHDLRGPLTAMRANASVLAHEGTADPEVVGDIISSIDNLDRMIADLAKVAIQIRATADLNHTRITIADSTDHLRRRLRALVHGRPIRVSVFRTREAPDEIFCDRLLFDRVVDNLLTNAAKYTEQGSIVVELDGKPGYLTLKVSDSGRGIADDQLERVFEAGGGNPETRGPQSYGVGLSIVVRLLSHIGGRIEVISKPSKGTTFWAYFPVQPKPTEEEDEPPASSNVVTIRRIRER